MAQQIQADILRPEDMSLIPALPMVGRENNYTIVLRLPH